jgi:hypothetical protein
MSTSLPDQPFDKTIVVKTTEGTQPPVNGAWVPLILPPPYVMEGALDSLLNPPDPEPYLMQSSDYKYGFAITRNEHERVTSG